ncbi:hypothetical protein INT43_008012 [Umbelopsis isabellina]|uniref:Uncharacterized protein n=1 Tax=Mortierella isabellina TaxID=91625 RepID=A0A8H7PP54_MORIS|nr:hypothetical protein INT43_008012 [Umbelopsis isabellina]
MYLPLTDPAVQAIEYSPVITTLATFIAFTLVLFLVYKLYRHMVTERVQTDSLPSTMFYEYNRSPRPQNSHPAYGAVQHDRHQETMHNNVAWLKARDQLLKKYAATESPV